jgi:hypothetical protein
VRIVFVIRAIVSVGTLLSTAVGFVLLLTPRVLSDGHGCKPARGRGGTQGPPCDVQGAQLMV